MEGIVLWMSSCDLLGQFPFKEFADLLEKTSLQSYLRVQTLLFSLWFWMVTNLLYKINGCLV